MSTLPIVSKAHNRSGLVLTPCRILTIAVKIPHPLWSPLLVASRTMIGFHVGSIIFFVGFGVGGVAGYFVLTEVLSWVRIYGEGIGMIGVVGGMIGGAMLMFRMAEKLGLIDD